ncbi:hypothetical protein EC845_3053 [Comamonas sp. BIGb0124]|uniref:hypothetical protein n=1 Tax=Comamonas sp. BIGb0124 TaxID=2485130 RepID=UPI000F4689DC|nr:hypothetical protein [Comamonas sp. BIGb0124]ROR20234.1 hypothetical protein EC845_3053 [Comamonas sp. BIGb0124]
MQNWIAWLQWPAMLATIGAAWCVASNRPQLRWSGFWLYLASNALWVAWGWSTQAYALIVLQFALLFMNIRGLRQNDREHSEK